METQLEQRLIEAVGTGNLRRDEPMSAHTTFRIGGPADYFVTPPSADAVKRVVAACDDCAAELFVIGCGSNVLVADAGLRGVVMKIGSALSDVAVSDDGSVTAQAGATNARVARAALEAGLAGFEFAAGIPGSIGGAAIMNAGAYGGELRDVARGVTCLAPDRTIVRLAADEAQWGYRSSLMGDHGHIVLDVELQLHSDEPSAIRARMDDLATRRSDKQPLDVPSAGSTFKRPAGHYAGKLIQDAGMQGHTVGKAQVSFKHAGFIVNRGGASAEDVRRVIEDVQKRVHDRFGIMLEPEVRLWGFEPVVRP